MLSLRSIAERIAVERRALRLSQSALAEKAHISRSTLDALENGRMGELGYAKVANLLAALGLELSIHKASLRRPTLEDLLRENGDD